MILVGLIKLEKIYSTHLNFRSLFETKEFKTLELCKIYTIRIFNY